jgi:Glycosyl transferase family 11
MITVSLIGGLGNQMFQYAAGKMLAARHGVPLVLDLGGFRRSAQRSFMLDRLFVPEAANMPKKAASHFVRGLWKRRVNRLLDQSKLPKLAIFPDQYCEPHFHYDPEFERLGPNTSLFGDFQSERYFSAVAGCLRAHFSPRLPFGVIAAKQYARIEGSALPVSIHVRRGDYANPAVRRVHGILGSPYYRRAINQIEAMLGQEADFFVFSDEPAAAEELLNFIPSSRRTYVRSDPKCPWEDMALMARCRHHVIANSSFSWWGAWLNGASDKIVIAPRAWFGPDELKKRNMNDLYPSGWIVV